MKVIIADEDGLGNTVIREEETNVESIAEPSAIFWGVKEDLDGKKSVAPASRDAFMRTAREWFASLG